VSAYDVLTADVCVFVNVTVNVKEEPAEPLSDVGFVETITTLGSTN
jgi:hypothetical protein